MGTCVSEQLAHCGRRRLIGHPWRHFPGYAPRPQMRSSSPASPCVRNQKRPPRRAAVKEGVKHSAYPRERRPSPRTIVWRCYLSIRYGKPQRCTAVLDSHMRLAHIYSEDARIGCLEDGTGTPVDALGFVAYYSSTMHAETNSRHTDSPVARERANGVRCNAVGDWWT